MSSLRKLSISRSQDGAVVSLGKRIAKLGWCPMYHVHASTRFLMSLPRVQPTGCLIGQDLMAKGHFQ
jgi:hypothetical protein